MTATVAVPNYLHHPSDTVLTAVCSEKTGQVRRTVHYVWPCAELEDYLWARLEGLPSMFSGQPLKDRSSLRSVWDTSKMFFMIDNVGLFAVDLVIPSMPNVHVTYWDKRLRGRERLVAAICDWLLEYLNVPAVFTQMPAASKATLAYAKRVGFVVTNWYSCSTWNAKNELDDLVELTYRGFIPRA